MTAASRADFASARSSGPLLSDRRALIGLNLVGGVAVLASYAWGPIARPDLMGAIWGGVPEALRPLYQLNMLLAAAGYLVFTAYLVFGTRLEDLPLRLRTRLNRDYALVLFPSALWLPLTVRMLEQPSGLLWFAIRLDLLLVGVGAIGILLALLRIDARASRFRTAAVAGALPFVLQTAVLDALVWPAFYPL